MTQSKHTAQRLTQCKVSSSRQFICSGQRAMLQRAVNTSAFTSSGWWMQGHGWKPEPVLLVGRKLSLASRLAALNSLDQFIAKHHKRNGSGRFSHPGKKEPLIFHTSGKQYQDSIEEGKLQKANYLTFPRYIRTSPLLATIFFFNTFRITSIFPSRTV